MRFFLHMCNFCCTFAAAKFFIYFIMVHDLYILMITAGVVSLLFKLLKQPGRSVRTRRLVGERGECESLGRHRSALRAVLHRSGVPIEEPHQ